jgi:putative transposase
MSKFHEPMFPDRIYHVINHANGFENIFANQDNYRYFLQQYAKYIFPIARTYAYCLMPNHFHLLIRIRSEEELEKRFMELKLGGSRILQGFETLEGLGDTIPRILSQQFSNLFNGYTQAFNKQQNRKGALFIPRFKRKLISHEDYFFTCLRYIHQNPVRHGFTKELMEWEHSSIHSFVGNQKSKVEREEVIHWFANNYKAGSKEFWIFHNQGWELDDLDLEI